MSKECEMIDKLDNEDIEVKKQIIESILKKMKQKYGLGITFKNQSEMDIFDTGVMLGIKHSQDTYQAQLSAIEAENTLLKEQLENTKLDKPAHKEGYVLPIEPTQAIKYALSYPCFTFIGIANLYRKHGFDIPRKAEDEQSFFLYKLLILAIKHDKEFMNVFNAEIKAMIEAQEY